MAMPFVAHEVYKTTLQVTMNKKKSRTGDTCLPEVERGSCIAMVAAQQR